MKTREKLLLCAVMISLLSLFFALLCFAADPDEGNMLEDGSLHYSYADGVLTIEGSANAVKLPTAPNQSTSGIPWYSYRNEIKEIVIDSDNATAIQKYLFRDLNNLEKVTMPASIATIPDCVFVNCNSLKQIRVSEYEKIYTDETLNTAFFDLRNVNTVQAYAFNKVSKNVPGNIDILLGVDTSFDYRYFMIDRPTTEGYSVTFKVFPGTDTADATKAACDNPSSYASLYPNIKCESHNITEKLNGNNVYTFDSNTGTLKISSTSENPTAYLTVVDYANNEVNIPWITQGWNDKIKEVNIESPVTTFGKNVFRKLTALEEMTLPSSLVKIEDTVFAYDANLKRIKVAGTEYDEALLSTNFYDLRSVKTVTGWSFTRVAGSVSGDIEIMLADDVASTTTTAPAIREFMQDRVNADDRVIFNVKAATSAEKLVVGLVGNAKSSASITDYVTAVISGDVNTNVPFVFDMEKGLLTISGTIKTLDVSGNGNTTGEKLPWVAGTWNTAIKEIVVETSGTQYIGKFFFKHIKNCESITIPSSVVSFSQELFAGASSLKNILVSGVDYSDKFGSEGIYDMRNITSVNGWSFSNTAASVEGNINILFGNSLTALPYNTFMSDSAEITFVVMPNSQSETLANAVKAASENTNVADKINVVGYTIEKFPELYVSPINMDGFSIRYSGYNGLRGIFSFDSAVAAQMEALGYDLLSYGAVAVADSNYGSFGGVEVDAEGNPVAVGNKVIVAPVYNAVSDSYPGKILKNDEDTPKNITRFALTVTNYTRDLINRELYMCAYIAYIDSDENIHVYYADYTSKNANYELVSIYETTLDMYKAGVINASDDKDGVMWDVLSVGAAEFEANTDYNAENVTDMSGNAFGDKFTALEVPMMTSILSEDGTKVTFEDSGVTYTLLEDSTSDGFVILYRKADVDGATYIIPEQREWNEGYRAQYHSAWLENDKLAEVAVPTARPNPVFVDANVFDKITYAIVDEGVLGSGHEVFHRLKITGMVYSESFDNVGAALFQNCSLLKKAFEKGTEVDGDIIDLSGISGLDTSYLANGASLVSFVKLPEGITTLGNRMLRLAAKGAVVIIPDSCTAFTIAENGQHTFDGASTAIVRQKTANQELYEYFAKYKITYTDLEGNVHTDPSVNVE